jgi:hypothetical protein
MGAIVRIRAFNPLAGDFFTVWESPDGEGDPTIQYRHQLRTEYRVFRPLPICQTSFKTDTIRIELDTRTVTDWNELDYVQLTGSLGLPHGVLPEGTREIIYVPDPNAFGEDVFSYSLSDCPFDPRRQPLPATVAVSIAPVNDPPVAANLTITDPARYIVRSNQSDGNFTRSDGKSDACFPQADIAVLDLSQFISDVDNPLNELNYTFEPKGAIHASLSGSTLRLCSTRGLTFGAFEIPYMVADPDGLVATGVILCLCEAWTETDDESSSRHLTVAAVIAALMGCVLVLLTWMIYRNRAKARELLMSFLSFEGILAVEIGLDIWDFAGGPPGFVCLLCMFGSLTACTCEGVCTVRGVRA